MIKLLVLGPGELGTSVKCCPILTLMKIFLKNVSLGPSLNICFNKEKVITDSFSDYCVHRCTSMSKLENSISEHYKYLVVPTPPPDPEHISCGSLITWLLCNWLVVAIKGNSSTLAAWPDKLRPVAATILWKYPDLYLIYLYLSSWSQTLGTIRLAAFTSSSSSSTSGI